MVFCNLFFIIKELIIIKVTILILIDGFLQFKSIDDAYLIKESHNPYFNRWFSAICVPTRKIQQ